MTKGTLHLLCGKAASGKSTLAATLVDQENGILLAEDAFLAPLFGPEMKTLQDYVSASARLKEALRPLILQMLAQGLTLVLDFPANTVGQRAWLRGLIEASGCNHTLHYLDLSDQTCKARLRVRNQQGTHPFTLTDQQYDDLARYFVPPSQEEGFEIVAHHSADEETQP
jgi:predicted kinase